MRTKDALARSELFGHLSERQLSRLADRTRGYSYQPGERVFREGEDAVELYVLTAGQVALDFEIRPVPDRPAMSTTVEVITEGECFGWSSLVEPHVYTASARCASPCTAIALRGDMLRRAMEDDPVLGHQVMSRLAKIVSSRLTHTRMRLTTGLGLIMQNEEPHLSGVGR